MVKIDIKQIKTVLIGEDEEPLAKALTFKFENKGYKVVWAKDGSEVIANLNDGKADVLLLDLMMPKVNGFDVLEHVKNNGIDIPIFVSSNLGQNEDRDKVAQYDVKEFFVKANTSLNDIIDTVDKELQTK